MNCKPGDLAIVTRPGASGKDAMNAALFEFVVGRVVRVTRIVGSPPVWEIEDKISLIGCAWFEPGYGPRWFTDGHITGIPDDMLTPLPPLPVDEETRDEVPHECA